ncbi:hypothetical protein CRE_24271 [Caenorhabditis remanei]|uniref:Uncharacterized protein n=1 Tax=Caenorhabditis remanei TaxID=31234 RepID=E3NJ31_CAERE|nr:hypothetical protein CRE_24271 [Caenorhabditis remanei]
MRAMHQLDNDTCVEEERDEDADVEEEPIGNGMDGEQEEEYDGDKEETLLEEDEDGDMPNLTLHEEYVATEESEVVDDAEMIETTAMSPAKPTLVV